MHRALTHMIALALPVTAASAQFAADSAQKTFFVKRDLVTVGAIVAGSAVVSAFDERIARWTQTPRIQGDSSRGDLVDALTVINETPLTIAAFAVYGIGRLAGNATMADVGLHTTESLVLTVGLAELVRGPLGRVRPRSSPNDAFRFEPGKGFTDFAARSYPSIHAAVAFATASSLVGELRVRKPEAVKWAAPVLYTAALVPGFTRLYLNQHWASDIVAGTAMGAWLGSRVVSYAHSRERSKLDRALLGAVILPNGSGGVSLGATFSP